MDIGYRQIHGHDYAFVIVFDDDDEFETFCSEMDSFAVAILMQWVNILSKRMWLLNF